MPTIDDIVNLSGASRSTVNRFLAGQTVRGDNARRIKSAMKELNYRPDKLVEKRNCTIEIIGGSAKGSGGFLGYEEMRMSMVKTLEQAGATVMIQPTNTKYIPRADGVICFGLTAQREDEIIEALKLRNIPLVFAYREIMKPGVNYVTCDNYQAAYEVTEMLIKRGHTKIAVCGGDGFKRNMPEKLQGFKDCMKHYNLEVPERLVNPTNSNNVAKDWLNSLLDDKVEFTALFALRDGIAVVFCDVLKQRGFKIPGDYVVVGMDGSADAVFNSPKITGVTIPFIEMGKKAAEAIFELIDEPETVCVRKYLKYEITEREST